MSFGRFSRGEPVLLPCPVAWPEEAGGGGGEVYVGQCSKEEQLLSPRIGKKGCLILNTEARLNGAYSKPLCPELETGQYPHLLPTHLNQQVETQVNQVKVGLHADW